MSRPIKPAKLSNLAIVNALEEAGGSVTHAAKLLKTTRSTLSSVITRRGGRDVVEDLAVQEQLDARDLTMKNVDPSIVSAMTEKVEADIDGETDDERRAYRAEVKKKIGDDRYNDLILQGIDPADISITRRSMTATGAMSIGIGDRIVPTQSRGLRKKGEIVAPRTTKVPHGGDEVKILEAAGIAPDEIQNHMITGYDIEGRPHIVRRVVPVQATATPAPRVKPLAVTGKTQLIGFMGCQHAPHHDVDLHELACAAVAHMGLDALALLGDGGNYADLGGFMRRPDGRFWDSFDECTAGEHAVYADLRAALPDARITWQPGNHGNRYDNYVMKNASAVAGARQAGTGAVSDLPHYVNLAALDIDVVKPINGRVALSIVPGVLNAVHGTNSKPRAGDAAETRVRRTGVGVVQADSHKQGIAYVTFEDEGTGETREMLAMEIGAMADTKGGLGHTEHANWQQGFGTVELDEDNRIVSADLATYRQGVLSWRGLRWWKDNAGRILTTAPAK